MKKQLAVLLAAGAVISLVSGCAQEVSSATSEKIFVGLMGAPEVLDPAGTRNLDDVNLLSQVMPTLLTFDPLTEALVPDLAESAEYTSGLEYTVKLKPNLTFSNGHPLTSSDVVHSIQRIKTINDPDGPVMLMDAIESVEASDDLTIIFTTSIENDLTVPALLAGLPGLIVDEEVFPADTLAPNDSIVSSGAWAGPYKLDGFNSGSAANLVPNEVYAGFWGVPENQAVELRYYGDADQLTADSVEMRIDVALIHHESLAASTFDATQAFAIDFVEGPLVETGFFSLNGIQGPFSPATYADNQRTAGAVRMAFDRLVDKNTVVSEIAGSLFSEAQSLLPGGSDKAGGKEQDGGDESDYERFFQDQAVSLPIQVSIGYPESLYGLAVSGLVTVFERELEATDLFDVELVALSDADFASQQRDQTYDALFDYHYPLYPDSGAYLYPFYNDTVRLGIGEKDLRQLDDAMSRISNASKGDRDKSAEQVDRVIRNAGYLSPLLWAGRQALVRDGVAGSDVMLGAGGQLVLADLKRILVD